MLARAVAGAVLCASVAVGGLGIEQAEAAPRTWYVAPGGSDGSSGSQNSPFRTIQHAVKVAVSGDVVILRGGTYHQSVQVYREAIHLRSADGERATLDGRGTLPWGIYLNDADGSKVDRITVRGYATPASNMAAIRAYSDNIVLSGVDATNNSRIGVSAIGRNIVIRDGRFNDNGHLGVHGHQLNGFVLERSAVRRNNAAGFDPTDSAGGLKLTTSTGVTIRDNDVSNNAGPGIWTDIDSSLVTISGNLVEANLRAGVEVELSSRVNVVDNVLLGNGEAGIWVLESQNVNVFHNASFRNQNAIEVEEGPRRDVAAVTIANNTMGSAASGSRALLDVNDWTEQRSAAAMGVRVTHNAYWVPSTSATKNVSRWARWPQPLAWSTSLTGHQSVTGQDAGARWSNASTNPYVTAASSFDHRAGSSVGVGNRVTDGMAAALGVPSGSRLAVGPVTAAVRR